VPVSGNGGDQTTAFVHTHGARLVRLARLLGADQPEQAAADAMAATSMRWSRRRDAHEHLLAAARRVAHSGTPPVREDTRLHAWLDRAELEPYEVDVTALSERTGHELLRHAAALRRRRLWWVAGAAAAVVLAAASSLWPGDDRDPMRTTAQDPSAQTAQPGGGGPSSPPKQRAVRRVESSGVVLRGRALTIMQTSVYNDVYVATMLAIGCTSKHGARAICLVSAPPSGSLSEIDDDAVVAYLPRPRHGDPVSDTLPTVLRDATTHALTNQTLLVDATSRDVEAVRVTYTDGSQVVASRYDVREWGARLFMARNKDVQPVDVVYLDSNGRTLARRSPTFAVR
jgi:hypothetical protein